MKSMMSFMSIGFTVAGTFLLAYFIGVRVGHLGAAFVIAALFILLYIIGLIKNEIR
ncbi:MAG: hypothetical protein IKF68_06320 [Erysipelotrichaceae bacterium]|nr:hypothetical protein [Erysipelotrichaceae bacterium]